MSSDVCSLFEFAILTLGRTALAEARGSFVMGVFGCHVVADCDASKTLSLPVYPRVIVSSRLSSMLATAVQAACSVASKPDGAAEYSPCLTSAAAASLLWV